MTPSLPETLRSVSRAVAQLAPHLVTLFRPGIPHATLADLESGLLPFRLPESVRALYAWHDGAEAPLELMPPYAFMSFSEAIAQYRFLQSLEPGSEGWNPIWFPVFQFSRTNHCVLLSHDSCEDSPVLQIDVDDTEIYLTYPSVPAFLEAVAECFATGAIALEEDYLIAIDELAGPIQAKHGNLLALRRLDGVRSYSKFFTQTWPESWRHAIGRTAGDYECKGATATVASFLSTPDPARVHATIDGLAGGSGESLLRIRDATGSMIVHCPHTAVGSREVQLDRHYEFTLQPCQRRPAELADAVDWNCDGATTHMILIR